MGVIEENGNLDCCGKEIRKEVVCLDRPAALRNIPVNGMAELSSC